MSYYFLSLLYSMPALGELYHTLMLIDHALSIRADYS